MENNTADEQSVENAPETNSPEVSQEKTAAELLAEKEAEIVRLSEERENYRKAALKAKGKYRDEDDSSDEEPSIDELIDRKLEERLFSTRRAEIELQKEEILKKALRENEEMKLALANRGQVSTSTSSGANLDKPESKGTSYWSPEQEAALRARGLDPEKVLKNMNKGMPPPSK